MSASTEETQEERVCNQCNKVGTTFQRCGRCKLVHYCSRDCQAKNWPAHKAECIPPEKRPPPVTEDTIVGYVECATYEECKNYLQKHAELITKAVCDEMYEKAFLTLKTHPPEFGTRFIRNAQILQYLLDIRKASGGQQDITLFFTRLLDPTNKEYLQTFTLEYQGLVKRIIQRHKEKDLELKKQQENKTSDVANDENKDQ